MESKKKVIDLSVNYIYEHINEPLVVKHIATQFHFSEYYFNRLFREVTGESVYAFIKRVKLEQSAIDLKIEKAKPITDIGLNYGYSASNYSTAFKKQIRKAPAAYRRETEEKSVQNPFINDRVEQFKEYKEYDSNISIENLEDMEVVYERMKGSYEGLKEAWKNFLEKYKDLIANETLIIERFFDDPSITDGNCSVCDLCLAHTIHKEVVNTMTISGGKFAVYHYEGNIKDIYGYLQGVYTKWLPQSSFKMREHSSMNIYRVVDWEANRVTMDLYIPVE